MKVKRIILFFLLLSALIPTPLINADPGWLAGWDKRIKLTIDSSDVDSVLTHFPVLIKISGSSGWNTSDVTAVFDEVGANSLKIAVTQSDGTTELYVEIESWNNVTEQAVLWVSDAGWSISNITDTIMYLYYDNDHADNNAKVGVVGSAPGELVWDASFLSVHHLSESSGNFLDSTSNDNDATAQGTVNRNEQKIDGGIDLPGTNDYVRVETNGIIDGLDDITLETWVYLDVQTSNMAIISDWGSGDDTVIFYYSQADDKWRAIFRSTVDAAVPVLFGTGNPSGGWYYVVTKYARNDFVYGYENGVKTQGEAANDFPLKSPNNLMYVGINRDLGFDMNGKMDDVRISSTARSDTWIEVTYETGRDHLLLFGEEEIRAIEAPAYLFGAGFNNSSPFVNLRWASNLTDISFFEIQNSTDKITWEYLGQSTNNSYNDFQVVNGTERYYRVRACNFTGAVWVNSTFTDINFEKVYYVAASGETVTIYENVTGAWVDYNFTSISTLVGNHTEGFLNSTYFKDDNNYTVKETVGAPGYDIRFNVTGLPDNLICLCLDLFMFYDGSTGHTFQIEVWNFVDSNWDFIEDIPDTCCRWFNNTLECVPNDYVNNGTLMGRFYHPSPGNVNHVWGIDYGKVRVFVPYENGNGGVFPSLFPGLAIGIALLIIGAIYALEKRR